MAEKISKTARASMKKEEDKKGKLCPGCGDAMVATKLIRRYGRPGGMWWVCPKGDVREKIQ